MLISAFLIFREFSWLMFFAPPGPLRLGLSRRGVERQERDIDLPHLRPRLSSGRSSPKGRGNPLGTLIRHLGGRTSTRFRRKLSVAHASPPNHPWEGEKSNKFL